MLWRAANPLMEEILNRGLAFTSGPQWLYENVCAANGCSRWPARTADHDYIDAGVDTRTRGLNPGFLIGGVPLNFGISARAAEFVVLCHRSRRIRHGVLRKRSKFVHYLPPHGDTQQSGFDHADIFPILPRSETQFHHFVRTVPGNGLIIANARRAEHASRAGKGQLEARLNGWRGEGWTAKPATSMHSTCSSKAGRAAR